MKVWLDDIRQPHKFGRIGWVWAKTAQEAIAFLQTGKVEAISLDHDLSEKATLGDYTGEVTGMHVVEWMIRNDVYPAEIIVHSMNPAGRKRMIAALRHEGQDPIEKVAIL